MVSFSTYLRRYLVDSAEVYSTPLQNPVALIEERLKKFVEEIVLAIKHR